MPWDEKDIMTLREEFVVLARQEGANGIACIGPIGAVENTGSNLAKLASTTGARLACVE